jgi:radical SAM superfamily enzyme YgiQ (UPF0313 family)
MYLASSLLAAGHNVMIIDLAAKYYKKGINSTLEDINSFHPDIIGFNIYTETAKSAYDFISNLRTDSDVNNWLLTAGGPHTTAVPEETLTNGFDIAVRGEGEVTLVELAECCEDRIKMGKILGISFRTRSGGMRHNPPKPKELVIDRIPLPVRSLHLFDPDWYFRDGTFIGKPANLLTSRGCPAKCTFCANLVTGRNVRYRSIENVMEEIKLYYEKYSSTFFSILDDSFISDRKHTVELCDTLIQFQKREDIEIQWSCITRADLLDELLINKLVMAGCVSINFGIESGSEETLRKIKKGIKLDQMVKTLQSCQRAGLRIQVNFMLGFPWETSRHLEETLNFMGKIGPNVDAFSPRGVVIPYPGTELYEEYKDHYGFENWWLDLELDSGFDDGNHENDENWSFEQMRSVYYHDPALERDFFKYPPGIKQKIKRCLKFKGQETLKKLKIKVQ